MKNKSLYYPPRTRSLELTHQMPLAGSKDVKISDNTEYKFNSGNNESDWLTNKKVVKATPFGTSLE